ncbi:MAG TPA: hypothetical protein PL033_03180 [Candidatus Brocadiia bacterium]|nr:hypothetical protein [Candidatus Brocadiia bacterium]
MPEEKTCSICGKPLAEGTKDTGAETCPECAPQTAAAGESSKRDVQLVILQSILGELRKISRATVYESGSWLNIVGLVFQCLTFPCLVFAYIYRQSDIHISYLLLAILVQLMALSFFTAGK